MTKVILTFGEPIGGVDHTKVTFMSGTSTLSTTAGAVSSSSTSEVEITLTTALTAMDTNVTVALAADAVTDIAGNGNAALAATALVDETAPELSTATTPSNTEVLLSYNEPLDADSIPAASAFTVVVNTGGTTRTVSTAALDGTSGIVLTVSPAFRPGDVLTVGYAVPETNPIKDASANEAVALANQLVDNTLPATAPDMPGSLAANFNLISFLPPLVFNADLMDLTWTVPWHNGSPIEKFQYRYHTPIWDGTLTVKDLGASFLGCDTQEANKGCQPGELLTDHNFSYDSVNYQIDVIDLKGGTLTLEASRAFTAAALSDLTLHVGDLSFPFADATHSAGSLTWASTGLSWSEDDTVQLAIRGPVHRMDGRPRQRPGRRQPHQLHRGRARRGHRLPLRGAGRERHRLRCGGERREKDEGRGVELHAARRQRQRRDRADRGRRFGDGEGDDHQRLAVQHRPDDRPGVGRLLAGGRPHPGRGQHLDHHHPGRSVDRQPRSQRARQRGKPGLFPRRGP